MLWEGTFKSIDGRGSRLILWSRNSAFMLKSPVGSGQVWIEGYGTCKSLCLVLQFLGLAGKYREDVRILSPH